MSDLKLFRMGDEAAVEIPSSTYTLERKLQTAVERNMEVLFGVRFLESEYSTGARHGGRIDSIGIDENGAPVIFEYKRTRDENVINQGLYYLDWLLDHRGEFELLVLRKLGSAVADAIDWRGPRVICVANDFTKFDEHAIAQMNRSIELVRYRYFEGELLALELLAVAQGDVPAGVIETTKPSKGKANYKTFGELLGQASPELRDLFRDVEAACEALGDDVSAKELKLYKAFRRIKNFACLEVHPQSKEIIAFLKVDPDTVSLEAGFTRDMRGIGHFGTGDLEVRIRSASDLEKSLPLLRASYEAS